MQERGAVAPLTGRARGLVPLLVGVAALVVVADQVTKTLAVDRLSDHVVHVIWTLQLNLTFNSGVAFGLGKGITPLLVVVAVVVLFVVIGLSGATASPARAVAMGLLVGGAASNLADRVVRSNGGAVIDFLDLQWWPVFNVADIAVSCGVILLVLTSWGRQGEQPA